MQKTCGEIAPLTLMKEDGILQAWRHHMNTEELGWPHVVLSASLLPPEPCGEGSEGGQV